jgi:hypothetical protein
MSGHLYQLRSKKSLNRGDYFPVHGPWDTHGIVVKLQDDIPETDEGQQYLVRGTARTIKGTNQPRTGRNARFTNTPR